MVTLTKIPGIDYVFVCLQLSFAVHNVDEIPSEFESFELVEIKHGMVLDVLITPEVMETDEDLRSFSVDERQCYMEGERKLKFFKKYSVRNCEMECLSAVTLERCGCVPFYAIRNSTMPICRVQRIFFNCIREASIDVRLKDDMNITKACNCLPTCNTLSYKLEYLYNDVKKDQKGIDSDQIVINFRFKNGDFMPQRRYRQLTAVSLMAEGAGLLGLYCGVSILTIIELFYFISLRPLGDYFRKLTNRT